MSFHGCDRVSLVNSLASCLILTGLHLKGEQTVKNQAVAGVEIIRRHGIIQVASVSQGCTLYKKAYKRLHPSCLDV